MTSSDTARSTESEQPSKSEQRGPDGPADEVAPGILRIMLPIDLPGLGHVNCYVLQDERGLALVDPGLADGVSHSVLTERLADVGLDVRRVHTVVVTHSHFDHYGGISRLHVLDTVLPVEVIGHSSFGIGWRGAYDAVLEDEDSGNLVERSFREIAELSVQLVRETSWGTTTDPFPAELLFQWSEGIDVVDVLRPPDITTTVDDGDVIRLGGHEWAVIHTPGHCDDHICLWNEELGVLFSGDHVLPTITPHISGLSDHNDPLQVFFDSLERVEQLEGATTVLPAHGDPFVDAAERSRSIREHHEGRGDRRREIGSENGRHPVDRYMKLLFRERSWGNMAASETFAHLEWLRLHDAGDRDEVAGELRYEIRSVAR
jgi:glyoxylase-like metal-dependent hydrolase (beta-lactamase superfamily II)